MISRKERSNESPQVTSSGRPSSHSSAGDEVGKTPTPSSFVQGDALHGYPSARVAFDFSASSPFELSVSGKCIILLNACHLMNMNTRFLVHSIEGATVHVVEEDDGSGWVKVTNNHGGKGLIPASYLETADVKSLELSGGSEEPRGSGQFGRHNSALGPTERRVTLLSSASGI
jgi:hypothetical protein